MFIVGETGAIVVTIFNQSHFFTKICQLENLFSLDRVI